jgi:hypothetical protein
MQDDAAEDHQDKDDSIESLRRVMALHPIGNDNEPHQQKESGVHVNVDSCQLADLP